MITRHDPMEAAVNNPVIEAPAVAWRHSRWERETRYYELWVQQDLFGHWLLTRIWGRQGSALGQIRHEVCESYATGLTKYAEAENKQAKRGYHSIVEGRT
jgi:predicted DNA-binding WGR domain protein